MHPPASTTTDHPVLSSESAPPDTNQQLLLTVFRSYRACWMRARRYDLLALVVWVFLVDVVAPAALLTLGAQFGGFISRLVVLALHA